MNQPLERFHRPRDNAGLREAASGRNARSHLPAKFLDAKPCVIPDSVAASPAPTRAPPPAAPPPFAPAKPAEKRRRRWYQYSLRSLLILMLLVSLFMSWFTVKRKRALAQKKAVEAIVAADGIVQYDYEFDKNGDWVKGATGRGLQWLRKVVGTDYFDSVASVQVDSKEGVEGLAGLADLKSIEIDVTGFNASASVDECIKGIPEIEGVEELKIKGAHPGSAFDALGRLKQLKRLRLDYLSSGPLPDNRDAPDLSGLRSCKDLRDVAILNCWDLPEKTVASLNILSQLERLDVYRTSLDRFDVAHLSNLTKLRELRIVTEQGHGIAPISPSPGLVAENPLILEHVEEFSKFKRLEKLSLVWSDLKSSDLGFLHDLPALRELDLSNCPNIDDSAAPYLKKMKHLTSLNLEGAKISQAAAERIDDALPDCEVRY